MSDQLVAQPELGVEPIRNDVDADRFPQFGEFSLEFTGAIHCGGDCLSEAHAWTMHFDPAAVAVTGDDECLSAVQLVLHEEGDPVLVSLNIREVDAEDCATAWDDVAVPIPLEESFAGYAGHD